MTSKAPLLRLNRNREPTKGKRQQKRLINQICLPTSVK